MIINNISTFQEKHTMQIYINYTTVNTTDRTIVQDSVLYNIRRKGQEKKRPRLNLAHRNLDIYTLLFK